jgi:membrane-associated phospholipid phosphatase
MASIITFKKTFNKKTFNSDNFGWARIVSDVFAPPVVWIALSIPVAYASSNTFGEALPWAFIYSLFVCILPVAFIAYQLWAGNIGDIHMQHRHERYKPLFVTVISTIVGWLLLKTLNAPTVLQILAIISLFQITIISLVTLYWQISMHAMAITSATMAIGIVFNLPLAFLTIPLIMLVGAARLKLDRHTPAQIFAGAMVGVLVPVVLFLVAPHVLYAML